MNLLNLTKSRTVTIPFESEELIVTYSPMRIQAFPLLTLAMKEAETMADAFAVQDTAHQVFFAAIQEWNLHSGDEPLAISRETYYSLPLPIVTTMLQSLMRDYADYVNQREEQVQQYVQDMMNRLVGDADEGGACKGCPSDCEECLD